MLDWPSSHEPGIAVMAIVDSGQKLSALGVWAQADTLFLLNKTCTHWHREVTFANVNSAGLPRLPAVALEAPAHQQRAGAGQSRDKVQVACGVGVPVRGVVAEAGRGRHVRPGRGVVWSRYFSERRMVEMHEAPLRAEASGEHDWAGLEGRPGG